jgi:hypothetical protein
MKRLVVALLVSLFYLIRIGYSQSSDSRGMVFVPQWKAGDSRTGLITTYITKSNQEAELITAEQFDIKIVSEEIRSYKIDLEIDNFAITSAEQIFDITLGKEFDPIRKLNFDLMLNKDFLQLNLKNVNQIQSIVKETCSKVFKVIDKHEPYHQELFSDYLNSVKNIASNEANLLKLTHQYLDYFILPFTRPFSKGVIEKCNKNFTSLGPMDSEYTCDNTISLTELSEQYALIDIQEKIYSISIIQELYKELAATSETKINFNLNTSWIDHIYKVINKNTPSHIEIEEVNIEVL